jgi:hypothetical protein
MGPEQIWLITLGGFAAFLCNVLYMVGGTGFDGKGYKWLRRFVGAGILACAANGIAIYMQAWVWQYLLMIPSLIIGFSMGYGGDTTIEKVLKRSLCAVGILAACFIGLWATGFTAMGWAVMVMAGVIGGTSVVMGVWNPWNNAPLEQFLICQVLTLFVPFWCFVK